MKRLFIIIIGIIYALVFFPDLTSQSEAAPKKVVYYCHFNQDGNCVPGAGASRCDCGNISN